MFRRKKFKNQDLLLVKTKEDHFGGIDVKKIGQTVYLNSRSPPMLVVDINNDDVTVAFKINNKIIEEKFNYMCLNTTGG